MLEHERAFIAVISQYVIISLDETKLIFFKNSDKVRFNESLSKLKSLVNTKPIIFYDIYSEALQCLQILGAMDGTSQVGNTTVEEVKQKFTEAFKIYHKESTAQINSHQESLSKTSTVVEQHLKTIETLKKNIFDQEHENEKLEISHNNASEKVKKLEESQNKFETKTQELEAELKENQKSLKQYEAQLLELNKHCEDLKQSVLMAKAEIKEKQSDLDQLKGQESVNRGNAYKAYELEEKIKIFDQFFIPMEHQASISFVTMNKEDILRAMGFLKLRAVGFDKDIRTICDDINQQKEMLFRRRSLGESRKRPFADSDDGRTSPAKIMANTGTFSQNSPHQLTLHSNVVMSEVSADISKDLSTVLPKNG